MAIPNVVACRNCPQIFSLVVMMVFRVQNAEFVPKTIVTTKCTQLGVKDVIVAIHPLMLVVKINLLPFSLVPYIRHKMLV